MNKTIYYNDKKIVIYEKRDEVITNQDFLIDLDKINSDLNKTLMEFLTGTLNKNISIIDKNPEIVYKEIKKHFKYIEAAGGLIQNKSSYLFIKRLGKWDLPKGKIDGEETPQKAAIRECEEECGVGGLTIVKKLENTYHIYLLKGEYILKKTYWYLMHTNYEGKLIPQTEENIEEAVWFKGEDIKNVVLKNSYPTIIGLLQNSLIL